MSQQQASSHEAAVRSHVHEAKESLASITVDAPELTDVDVV